MRLQFGTGQRHGVVVRLVRIAQSGQHVCDRICHGTMGVVSFLWPVSTPGAPGPTLLSLVAA